MKEIDSLIGELPYITKVALGEVNLDIDQQLTLAGHGFGATTAIITASKDSRIKKLITFDPYLMPLLDEIKSGDIKVSVPHCSVNSEIFQH